MTQNRTNYLYKFTGKILKKRPSIASPTSKYAGQSYYVLTISEENHKRSLQVFPSKLANPGIWTTIEQGTYSGQYDFYCKNQKGYYYLWDWEKKPKPSPEPKPNDHDLN